MIVRVFQQAMRHFKFLIQASWIRQNEIYDSSVALGAVPYFFPMARMNLSVTDIRLKLNLSDDLTIGHWFSIFSEDIFI